MCLTKTILNAMIMLLVLILLRLNSRKELSVFFSCCHEQKRVMGSFLEKRYTIIINGYTESYHNQLKSHYFGHSRNTHVYRITYIILQIVLLDINKMMYVFDLV